MKKRNFCNFKKSLCFLLTLIFMFSVFSINGITVFAVSVKTPKTTSVTAKSSTSIKIKWGKIDNANGYQIYQKKDSGSYKKIKEYRNNSKTYLTVGSLASATKYTYKIRAYKITDGKKTYSSFSKGKSAYTKPPVPKIKSATSSNKTTIQLKWGKISKTNGYAIYRKTGSSYNRVATIKTNKTTSYTIKGLKSKKKYTFVLRSYIKKSGKNIYSDVSAQKSKYTKHTHEYKKSTVKPTCTKKGYTLHKCFCGKSYKSNYKNPAHHYKNYKCTVCGKVDKSNAYKYLKNYVIKNGEVDGAYVTFTEFYGDLLCGLNYSSDTDYIYISYSFYNSYDDFDFFKLQLNDYSIYRSIGENNQDYVKGKIDAKTFTDRTPLANMKYKNTNYTYASLLESTRSNLCDSIEWLSDFLKRKKLGITIADLGFKAYK